MPDPFSRSLAMPLLMGLAACGGTTLVGTPAPAPGEEFPILATLTYRERIALPADARAVLELREGSGTDSRVVAERRMALDGRQVPILIELRADRRRLDPARPHVARGGIVVDGRAEWLTDPVPVDLAGRGVELGTLTLRQAGAPATATTTRWWCGDREVTIDWERDRARLSHGGETYDLSPTPAASGTRYEAPDDPGTWAWNKGENALVSVRGTELPECTVITDWSDATMPPPPPFRAKGNEPFWSMEIGNDTLTFRPMEGAPVTFPAPVVEPQPGGRRYAAMGGGHEIEVTVLENRCTDDMSGMPHPATVRVILDGREYRGCGGEPVELLLGGEWVVEDIDRGGVIDNSRASLRFEPDGRLTGRASCNTYSARYALTGESLAISDAATTLQACAPALMAQEEKFLAVLRDVRRFRISETGALVLVTDDGRSMTARR